MNRPTPLLPLCLLAVLIPGSALSPTPLSAQAPGAQEEEFPQTSEFLPNVFDLSRITGMSWIRDDGMMKPERDLYAEAEGVHNVSSTQTWVAAKNRLDALGSMKDSHRLSKQMYAKDCTDPSKSGYDPGRCKRLEEAIAEQKKLIEYGENNKDLVKRIDTAGMIWVLIIWSSDIGTSWSMTKQQMLEKYQSRGKSLENRPIGDETLYHGDEDIAFTYTKIRDYVVFTMVRPGKYWRPILDDILGKITDQKLVVEVSLPKPGWMPVPGGQKPPEEVPVRVRVTRGKKPVPGLGVRLTILEMEKYPFLSPPDPVSQGGQVTGDDGNCIVPVTSSRPEHSDDLKDFPFEVPLHVSVLDDKGREIAAVEGLFPLGVNLLRGRTLGPEDADNAPHILKGRKEAPPGMEAGSAAERLFIDSASADTGEFWVLLRVQQKMPSNAILVWPDDPETCHLPLEYKISIPKTPAGKVVDLSRDIDLLSPEEHEKRIKFFVDQFLARMPLKSGAKGSIRGQLKAVPFGATTSVEEPFFGETWYNWRDKLYLPAPDEKTFWAKELVTGGDPAYANCFHEFGHWLHMNLVDTSKLSFLTKFRRGAAHVTWRPPKGGLNTQFFTSYAEATADLFATLLYHFIDTNYPEFKESLYYKQGYLADFWRPGVESQGLGYGGCRVEGVQTRFLITYYGGAARNRPCTVYGDYLATMFRENEESFFGKWFNAVYVHPARTIKDWYAMKKKYGGLVNAEGDSLARRFKIDPCMIPKKFVAHTYSEKLSVTLEIDGKEQVITGPWPGVDVSPGQSIKVLKGRLFLRFDPPVTLTPSLMALAGSEFRIVSPREVEVTKGVMAVPSNVTTKVGPGATVFPRGTAYMVDVAESGEAKVTLSHGEVEVVSGSDSRVLGVGDAVAVAPDGDIRDLPPLTGEEIDAVFAGLVPEDYPNPFLGKSDPEPVAIAQAPDPEPEERPVKKPAPKPMADPPPPPTSAAVPTRPAPASPGRDNRRVSLSVARNDCLKWQSKAESCDPVDPEVCETLYHRYNYHKDMVILGMAARAGGKRFDRIAMLVAPLQEDGTLGQARLLTQVDEFHEPQMWVEGTPDPGRLFQGYDAWVLLPEGYVAVGYGARINEERLKTLVLYGRKFDRGEWLGEVEKFSGGIDPDHRCECEIIYDGLPLVAIGGSIRKSDMHRFFATGAAITIERPAP